MQYLVHYGTKGMRWGERRYQNPDGSLTPLGREHYGVKSSRFVKGYNSPYTTELKRPKLYSFYGIQTPSGAKYEREVQDRRKYFNKKKSLRIKKNSV